MTDNKPASLTDIAFDTGVIAERNRILKILAQAEWHEETRDYTARDTDLKHIPQYCTTCQLQAEILNVEPTECTCDPCGDRECDCHTQRCNYCKAKNE